MVSTDRLLSGALAADEPRQWYVFCTKSRHEKLVYRTLEGTGVESFLPLRSVLSQWKDRRKLVEQPLFPGYLFVRSARTQLAALCETRGVAYVLGSEGNPTAVREEQVEAVRRMTGCDQSVEPWPYLTEGKHIRVTAGPLAGLEGLIAGAIKSGRCHLVVSIELLGRSVAVELDGRCVEVIC